MRSAFPSGGFTENYGHLRYRAGLRYLAKITKEFFAKVQNKLHWALRRHTAAELIMERANAERPHMGLTSWEHYPDGKIQKYDVSVAKNYLSQDELLALERIVSMYLDYAEYQAGRYIPMTMEDWAVRLDRFLELTEGADKLK